MKFIVSALCSAVLLVSHSSAATCSAGSLASYVTLGSAGCTIGNNTLANFTIDPGLNGGKPIDPTLVTLAPLGGSFDPGISTTVQQSAAGSIFEAIFTYRISGSRYKSETFTLSGSSETGGGGVTGLQNNCAGGAFSAGGVSGCSGVSGSLLTLDGVQNRDFGTFALPAFLNITDDLTIDGTGGTASGGTLTDRFSAVPEPSGITLSAIALFLASALLLRPGLNPLTRK